MSFPSKLYVMLEDAESQGFQNVISWQTGGKSFKVYKPDIFAKLVMNTYFAQSKFKSFQRQLNTYGWKMIQVGPNKGGYLHASFVRGQPQLCDKIIRRKESKPEISSTTTKAQVHSFPSFHQITMPPMHQAAHKLNESDVTSFFDSFYPKKDASPPFWQQDSRSALSSLFSLDEHDEVGPIASALPQVPGLGMNDADLDDFVTLLAEQEDGFSYCKNTTKSTVAMEQPDDFDELMINFDAVVSAAVHENGSISEEAVVLDVTGVHSDLSFPFKLHLMLENAERDGYSHAVSWVQNGTAFKVHDQAAFVESVMPNFFDQSKYESFRRQLNLYQFKRVSRGDDRGVISHPSFVQGSRHLCKYISRIRDPNFTTATGYP